MPQVNERKSKAFSWVLAVLALLLTVGAGFLAYTNGAQPGLVLILAIVIGLALEGYSSDLAPAGYFSLASPMWVLLITMLQHDQPLAGFCLAVAITGISTIGRLFSPLHPLLTRLAGSGVNTIRILAVGGCIFLLRVNFPDYLIAAIAGGYLAWILFDLLALNVIVPVCEEDDFVQTWTDIGTIQNRLLLALPALACGLGGAAFGAGELTIAGSSVRELAVLVVVALLSLPFSGELSYWIDGIKVRDQEELEKQLRIAQHQAKTQREAVDKANAQIKSLSEQLSSLSDLAQSLGASTQLEETVGIVLSMVRRLRIPFQSCVILLYNRDKESDDKDKGKDDFTVVLAETPHRQNLNMSHLLQLEEPILNEVVESRRPRIKTNLPAVVEGRIFKDERSIMCVPLVVSKEIVGVIYVGSVAVDTHNEEHFKNLKMLSNLAAPSIKTAMIFNDKERTLAGVQKALEAVKAEQMKLEGLQEMGKQMGASLKATSTLRVVAESIKVMISEAQSVILFTHDPEAQDGHALKAEFAETPYADYVRNLALRDDEGVLGKAISSSSTLLFQDTKMFDVQNLLGSEHSVVVAPLFGGTADEDKSDNEASNSSFMGCLYVGAAKENALTEEHRNIIETISYQTAMALKNSRLYEQTQKMALTDGLTGLYTHRLFQEKLDEEILFAERTKQPVVLVMVDADNFKTYNDTLGHPAGDALLKEIASLLKDKVRASDIVARYGGDEFALLLKNTRKEDAVRMCERIREAFQLRFGGNQVQVTSSIGLACYPEDADSKKDLAQAADDALYVSKRGGRNRVSASKDLATRRKEGPMVQEIIKRPAEIEAEKRAAALKAAQAAAPPAPPQLKL